MNIQAEKLEIMRMVLETDNPKIITSIKKIFKKSAEKDFWETISQAQNEEMIIGIKETESGDIVDYEVFIY